MKKKLFTLLLVLAFIFPVAMLFVACGDKSENTGKKISRFEFQEPVATITYGDSLEHDPFGTKLVFSDGSQKSIDDVTADEAREWGLATRVTKFNEQTQQEEEWDLSQRFTVGSYSVYYSAPNVNGQVSLWVQKADYAGNVSVSMTSSMQYGGALAEPTLQFSSDTVTYVQFYYQRATDDGSYREDDPGDFDWGVYDYTADATCNLMPGNYQIYARFETKNYNQKRTMLKNFVVSKTNVDKTYALFGETSVYDPDTETYSWQLVPLDFNTPIEMEYFHNKSQKLSDYISHMNQVYVYEVDEHGDIMTDDQGQQVQGQSVAWCYASADAPITLVSSDIDINGAGTYNVVVRYSPDVSVYNPVTLSFRLKVNKLRFELSRQIGVWVSDLETRVGDIEYDGQDHHIVVNGINNVKEFDGVYYACVSYDEGTDHAYDLKVFTVSNYQRRNAGTYSVVCQVPSNMTNGVELAWRDGEEQLQVGSIVNLGTWTISPKYYQTEADILLNNKATDEYRAGSDYTLIYGGTYVVSAENIVATRESQVAADVHPTFASISAWVQDANTGAWVEATNGVTIDNTTHTITIAELCPYTYVELRIAFAIDNANYTAGSITLYFYLKQAVQYYSVNGTIYNAEEYVGWKAEYHEASQQNWGKYVSADGQTYLKWADVYNTLYYYSDFDTTYVKNTSSDIYNNRTYYLHENDTYRQLRFYVLYVGATSEVEQTNNTVGYDAKEKSADATIGLIGISAQSWASNYGSLYVTQEQVVQNNSDEIDFGKSYYVFDGTNYIRVYLYYSDGNSYVEATNRIDGVSDYYYVLEGVNANEQGLTEEQQPKLFATYYNNLYYYQTIYVQNTSSVLNWNKTYYKHISGDNYVNVYMYYKVGDGYICTYNAVEGVTDYYFAEDYHYLTDPYLVKFDGNDWVEVSEAREVGQYRTVFKVIMSGNRVLVDGEGNYLSEVYYEWEIVNNLTKTKVVSCTPVFEDVNGDALPVTGNVVTISSGENAYLNLNITLTTEDGQPLDVRYVAVVATKRAGDLSGTSYGYQSEDDTGAYYTNVADTYVTRVYFVFVDGEHCMTDASGNVIEYIEFTWQVEVNE